MHLLRNPLDLTFPVGLQRSDKLSYIGLGGELLGLLAFNSWSGKDLGAFN